MRSRPSRPAASALFATTALAALALAACGSSGGDDAGGGAGAAGNGGSAGSGGSDAGDTLVCDNPSNPFMAPNGESNIHGDAYMSDAYAWAGPAATAKVVAKVVNGECATVTFDAKGRLITICIAISGAKTVTAMDPHTLDVLATWDGLPKGLSTNGFGGGGYFYLDDQSRAVVPTIDGHVVRVALADGPPLAFAKTDDWDLTASGLATDDGSLESALPDWSGRIWWVTENGALGYVDPANGAVKLTRLAGEKIGNSFAVDETGGVFVVSDHALYRFDVDGAGAIATTWREEYDRGSGVKPGQVNFGSGTTPTLIGADWVAITDNADPRMDVLLYARGKDHAGTRKLCQVPVFADGASATENSLIGCGRSIVVENNYGYSGIGAVTGSGTTTPGITRVDVADDGTCSAVWTADVAAPSVVAKLSVASRAVYAYTKAADGWYLTALDFDSGSQRFQTSVGNGATLNNNYAPVTLAADGTGYVGTLNGLLAFVAP